MTHDSQEAERHNGELLTQRRAFAAALDAMNVYLLHGGSTEGPEYDRLNTQIGDAEGELCRLRDFSR